MSPAVITFESFAPESAASRTARLASQAADQAYRTGFADGRAAQSSDEAAALIQAIREMAQELSQEDRRRAALRQEAVRALSPILSAILDAVAAPGMAARLETTLIEELARLAQSAPAMTCHVTCPSHLRPHVERCAREAGLEGLEIIEKSAGSALHLSLQGGQIEFSQERVLDTIRALIREIQED